MLHLQFFEFIFVFSASKYIGYDVKIVIFWKFIFDILSIRSSSIEFSFALCIAQTLIKFKNISYTYSMLLNPLALGCCEKLRQMMHPNGYIDGGIDA